jgi:O-antigen/teichoic acid export membrane protein
MMWIDNLMLGYYKSSKIVGLYNSAAPIAKLLPIFLNCSGLIYPSLVTIFYTQGKLKEMGRVYQILTKWIFLATLPIFIIIFLFPKVVISFFFGCNYISSALALRILALGFMFHIAMGLNGISLVVIKDSNFIMYSTLISAVLNVILNILLIPSYGIIGASIATAVSYFIMNILNSLRLYQKMRIHPFSRSYVKILAISIVLLSIIGILDLKMLNIWYTFLILVIFLVIYLLILLISKSIDEEDIKFLLAIEKKLNLNLTLILKILRKFI